MPNWCYNTLTIQGPKDQVDYIKEKLNRPFTVLHDRWNMETQEMEISETTYSAPVFAFWNIHSPLEDGITMEEYVKQPARLGIDTNSPDWFAKEVEFAKTQHDWYNWNTSNWGTKWDVAVSDDDKYPETELLEHMSKGEDQWLVYKYNTAWGPAGTAALKLSKLVPNCVVTLNYEEETGWGGELEFVNGKTTAESDYESKCRDCDAEDTLDYCENDCGQICSACNYMGEADLECVKECQTHKVYLDSEHVPDYRMEQLNG
jgi:Ferredoxin-like domain in Api92-like protein